MSKMNLKHVGWSVRRLYVRYRRRACRRGHGLERDHAGDGGGAADQPQPPDALGRDRAARRLRGGQRHRRGLRAVPRDHRRAARGLAGRRGHRRRPSHPGDPAPGQRRGPRRLAGHVARGDPGRPGQGGRHRGRRGRRGRHAPAPGRRWLGCRRALHAGDRPRRLAADAARVRAGLPARLGPGDAVRPRGRARSSACRRRPRSTPASTRTTTTRSSSSAGSTAPSARKTAPMSRASTPPPPRCRCGTRPRARSAPRRARRSRRTRRIFALLAMAMGDASIAGWDTKYHYNFWRPVTAIRAGDTRRQSAGPTRIRTGSR